MYFVRLKKNKDSAFLDFSRTNNWGMKLLPNTFLTFLCISAGLSFISFLSKIIVCVKNF